MGNRDSRVGTTSYEVAVELNMKKLKVWLDSDEAERIWLSVDKTNQRIIHRDMLGQLLMHVAARMRQQLEGDNAQALKATFRKLGYDRFQKGLKLFRDKFNEEMLGPRTVNGFLRGAGVQSHDGMLKFDSFKKALSDGVSLMPEGGLQWTAFEKHKRAMSRVRRQQRRGQSTVFNPRRRSSTRALRLSHTIFQFLKGISNALPRSTSSNLRTWAARITGSEYDIQTVRDLVVVASANPRIWASFDLPPEVEKTIRRALAELRSYEISLVRIARDGVTVSTHRTIIGSSTFPSVIAFGVLCGRGDRRYYEVEIQRLGLVQVGWVRPNVFDPRVGGNGRGVGDMANTYAFDGTRARKLGGGVAAPYGPRLRKGDVLGCLWDGPSQTISFRLNGASLEVAFSGVDPLTGLCPAVSVGSGARVILNFNSVKYLPEGFQCVEPTAAGLQAKLPADIAASVQRTRGGSPGENWRTTPLNRIMSELSYEYKLSKAQFSRKIKPHLCPFTLFNFKKNSAFAQAELRQTLRSIQLDLKKRVRTSFYTDSFHRATPLPLREYEDSGQLLTCASVNPKDNEGRAGAFAKGRAVYQSGVHRLAFRMWMPAGETRDAEGVSVLLCVVPHTFKVQEAWHENDDGTPTHKALLVLGDTMVLVAGGVRTTYGARWHHLDTVSLTLDFEQKCIRLHLNGSSLGVVHRGLTEPVQIAVGIFQPNTRVTYIPPVFSGANLSMTRGSPSPSDVGEQWVVCDPAGALIRAAPESRSSPKGRLAFEDIVMLLGSRDETGVKQPEGESAGSKDVWIRHKDGWTRTTVESSGNVRRRVLIRYSEWLEIGSKVAVIFQRFDEDKTSHLSFDNLRELYESKSASLTPVQFAAICAEISADPADGMRPRHLQTLYANPSFYERHRGDASSQKFNSSGPALDGQWYDLGRDYRAAVVAAGGEAPPRSPRAENKKKERKISLFLGSNPSPDIVRGVEKPMTNLSRIAEATDSGVNESDAKGEIEPRSPSTAPPAPPARSTEATKTQQSAGASAHTWTHIDLPEADAGGGADRGQVDVQTRIVSKKPSAERQSVDKDRPSGEPESLRDVLLFDFRPKVSGGAKDSGEAEFSGSEIVDFLMSRPDLLQDSDDEDEPTRADAVAVCQGLFYMGFVEPASGAAGFQDSTAAIFKFGRDGNRDAKAAEVVENKSATGGDEEDSEPSNEPVAMDPSVDSPEMGSPVHSASKQGETEAISGAGVGGEAASEPEGDRMRIVEDDSGRQSRQEAPSKESDAANEPSNVDATTERAGVSEPEAQSLSEQKQKETNDGDTTPTGEQTTGEQAVEAMKTEAQVQLDAVVQMEDGVSNAKSEEKG